MAERKFRKGDRVRFRFGLRSLEGVVKEDRGPIGVKGRHLYSVEFHPDAESLGTIELPAADMQPVHGAVSMR